MDMDMDINLITAITNQIQNKSASLKINDGSLNSIINLLKLTSSF